jgi:hypothetical protein
MRMSCNNCHSPLGSLVSNRLGERMTRCDGLSAYAEDTTLYDLGPAELFIVTVLRLWAGEHGGAPAAANWMNAFRAAGIEAGSAPAFDSLMWAVAGAAAGPLDLRDRRCRRLGRDEAVLLRLLSLSQHRRPTEAKVLLTGWLPRAATHLTMRAADKVAAGLATAGLIVPLRHSEAAALCTLAPCAHATPGLALVQ